MRNFNKAYGNGRKGTDLATLAVESIVSTGQRQAWCCGLVGQYMPRDVANVYRVVHDSGSPASREIFFPSLHDC